MLKPCRTCRRRRTHRGTCGICRAGQELSDAALTAHGPCTSHGVPRDRPEGAAFLAAHEARLAAIEARVRAELNRLDAEAGRRRREAS